MQQWSRASMPDRRSQRRMHVTRTYHVVTALAATVQLDACHTALYGAVVAAHTAHVQMLDIDVSVHQMQMFAVLVWSLCANVVGQIALRRFSAALMLLYAAMCSVYATAAMLFAIVSVYRSDEFNAVTWDASMTYMFAVLCPLYLFQCVLAIAAACYVHMALRFYKTR